MNKLKDQVFMHLYKSKPGRDTTYADIIIDEIEKTGYGFHNYHIDSQPGKVSVVCESPYGLPVSFGITTSDQLPMDTFRDIVNIELYIIMGKEWYDNVVSDYDLSE